MCVRKYGTLVLTALIVDRHDEQTTIQNELQENSDLTTSYS